MARNTSDWLADAFDTAKDDFIRSLKTPSRYDFSKLQTINDVYDATDEIQKKQVQTKILRGLKRIEPFIEALKEYTAVIEVFVQVKPDILALIWGPLKLLLQSSSSLLIAFDQVAKVLAQIGTALPEFHKYNELLSQNDEAKRVMYLFFVDILDFYRVLLDLIDNRRRQFIFEAFWPNIRGKVGVIQRNIDHHKMMMTSQVTMEHILQSYEARKRAIQEYERAEEQRISENVYNMLSEYSPSLYDDKLADILSQMTVASGTWLEGNPEFTKWADPTTNVCRCFWLYGIPGSGKTFLSASRIKGLQDTQHLVLFAFITHENQTAGSVIKIFHSLIFQAIKDNPSMGPVLVSLVKPNARKFSSDIGFVQDVLLKVLNGCDPAFIVIDGLDELEEHQRMSLLRALLWVLDHCNTTKLFISSRAERDIERTLKTQSISVRADGNNHQDIQDFANLECQDWILKLEGLGADRNMCTTARSCASRVVEKSQGMILYTKLVFRVLKDQGTASDIESELQQLPNGLDQAYERVLLRISSKITKPLMKVVHKIFSWMVCARRPLREEELLQALVIKPGSFDFKDRQLREFRDLKEACGPIIETSDGTIHFVHFSAREYILQHSNTFLDIQSAQINTAILCATYISYSSLNLLFSTEPSGNPELYDRIKTGDYVFFEYASIEWLAHVKAIRLHEIHANRKDDLQVALLRLFGTRSISQTASSNSAPQDVLYDFKGFNGTPNLQEALENTEKQFTQASNGFSKPDDTTQPDDQYLGLFKALKALRKCREELICDQSNHKPTCHCETIYRLYGNSVFYCEKAFCHRYRHGFPTKQDRDKHLVLHNRPYHCFIEDCVFYDTGFSSKDARTKHISQTHNISQTPIINMDPVMGQLTESELKSLLEDALTNDDLERVQTLTFQYLEDVKEFAIDLLQQAAYESSPNVLEGLIYRFASKPEHDYRDQRILNTALAAAIENKRFENIEVLLASGARLDNRARCDNRWKSDTRRGDSTSPRADPIGRAFTLWDIELISYLDDRKVEIPKKKLDESLFQVPDIIGLTEERFLHEFDLFKKYFIWPEAYSRGIRTAIRSKSIPFLRVCLESGGNPNYVFPFEAPLLYKVVGRGTINSMEMAKLLLKFGANPEVSHNQRNIRSLRKMKKLEAYFGYTWDEIVQRIQAGEDIQGTKGARKG
ncbi:hypothetical protein F4810DRAFT_660893 [Camillea tinctor]|nr:hypothetical protein F4810DRAFT_660893 [Camillea tinctor]